MDNEEIKEEYVEMRIFKELETRVNDLIAMHETLLKNVNEPSKDDKEIKEDENPKQRNYRY